MNEQEIEGGIEQGNASETNEAAIQLHNFRNEMGVIEEDIEAGGPLTPELLGHFQELGAQIADQEPNVALARFMLAFDSATLKFKAGFIEAAIDDLQELADSAYQAGEEFDPVVEIADDRRKEYEAALAKQPKA